MKKLIKFRITPGAFLLCAVLLYAVAPDKLIIALSGIAIHESGHIIAILLFSAGIESLTVRCGGFEIKRKRENMLLADWKNCVIALGGVIANLIGWAILRYGVRDFYSVADACLFFAVINSIPIPSLDGGTALGIALSHFAEPDVSERIGKIIGYVFLFLLWVLSVYLLFYFPDNPTPFVMCACVFLGEWR